MSVLLETSLGDITIDLFVEEAPKACEKYVPNGSLPTITRFQKALISNICSFLKLCKLKYYNYSPVHTVQPDFTFQTGDPIGPGSEGSDGGTSVWGLLPGATRLQKTFVPEFHPKLKHIERGTVSLATTGTKDPDVREGASQFLITLANKINYLDGKAAVFGRVVEGFDTLQNINTAFLDDDGRPLKDIRIRHTHVLDEGSIPDPPGFSAPDASPQPTPAQLATVRIADDEELDENADQEAVEKLRREREARAQALTLEMVGDLPFAEVAPPENVLFVCKLNPVTRDEDLELIFGRFGKILSCEVIRDKKTGDSLQYAFIEFAEQQSCEQAYKKMDDVLIDEHRIHVDFSQSVSRMSDVWDKVKGGKWSGGGRRGGFGGIEGLEKKRQYRAEDVSRQHNKEDQYRMVFDPAVDRLEGTGLEREKHRHRDRNRGYDRARDRGRKRDGSRDYHRSRRHRSRSRSPPKHRRERSRDRHRGYSDSRDYREPQDYRDSRDSRDFRDHRNYRDNRDNRDYRRDRSRDRNYKDRR